MSAVASVTEHREDEELREMRSRHRIYNALMRYCRGADRADTELMKSAYHPDATEEHGPFNGTAEAYCEFTRKYFRGEFDWSKGFRTGSHLLCNVSMEFTALSSAQVESYFLYAFQHTVHSAEINAFLIGRYLDHFEARAGQWGIARRRVVLDQYFETPTNVIDTVLAPSFLRGTIGKGDPAYSW